jgi:hypothetical protein
MHGDFARITFDPSQGFTRVLAQQGRMLLETELNEQTALHIHYLRKVIVDTIGPCWRAGDGFALAAGDSVNEFAIAAGRLYVDGILCELNANVTYGTQPFWPVPGIAPDAPVELPAIFLAYIEVHERHLSPVQMPALREIALGGRDTASRAQVAWQIRILTQDQVTAVPKQFAKLAEIRKAHPGPFVYRDGKLSDFVKALEDSARQLADVFSAGAPDQKACAGAKRFFDTWEQIGPLMRARARFDARNLDPCAIPADGQFRSRENQLYRVEIHKGGMAGEATFKWSRENGSVEFALSSVKTAQGGTITAMIDTLGRDRRTGLCEGDWVELTSDGFEFAEMAPPLGQITGIDRARRMVTLKVTTGAGIDFSACTLLRRWDQSLETAPDLGEDGAIPLRESSEGRWTPLERGVQVQFVPGGYYRTGDFWLIPARVATNDILWPQSTAGKPAALRPQGVERHRGVLGFGIKEQAQVTFTNCICTITPQCNR